ncbi:ABC transporter ATP-binding protein [Pseudoclavibacter terrae]|uniref:ABC transporter ATP-binding protein n=1 Tax=Pseudoclavibacter terrae TaxID=1530195 RepID=UPI00233007FA|nr:ABC transporter ATP-binding protein [Pseudoclavibacter terrae]
MSTIGRFTAIADGLVVGYGTTPVLDPVDVRIGVGVTALLGRNGGGKTTLMRTICGIIPALSGTISVLGEIVADGAAVRTRVGYLGHELAVARALTVQQNLMFWRDISRASARARMRGIDEIVAQFELRPILHRRVASLSRGQCQRVELARMSMSDPEFVVLDEPLTGLDPLFASQVRSLLRSWGETRTVLYSTHSVPEALALADRFLVVRGRSVVELGGDGFAVSEQTILRHLQVAA